MELLFFGTTSDTIRWNFGDFGFFDFMYNNKSVNTGSIIEHIGKDIYFRDIYLFIERIKKRNWSNPLI